MGQIELHGRDIPQLLSGIVNKLLDSEYSDPSLFLPYIGQFITYAQIPWQAPEELVAYLRDNLERKHTAVLYCSTTDSRNGEKDSTIGVWQEIPAVDEMVDAAITASYFGVHVPAPEEVKMIVDFEVYRYDYPGRLPYVAKLLDLIYCAQLQGWEKDLEAKLIDNPFDERCEGWTAREMTRAEAQAIIDKTPEYDEDGDETNERKRMKEAVAALFGEDGDKAAKQEATTTTTKLGLFFKLGMEEILPEQKLILYKGTEPSQVRPQYSLQEIRDYLGAKLVAALDLNIKRDPRATQAAHGILYRRNRVKKFLGGDVDLPPSLIQEDELALANYDIEEEIRVISECVAIWGHPDDLDVLGLTRRLTKEEYALYRVAREYIELYQRTRGVYDTPEKRALLPNAQEHLEHGVRLLTSVVGK